MTKEELKARRKALKLTQAEMAQALGVPKRTYEGWEAGRPIGRPGLLETAMRGVEAEVQDRQRQKPA